MQAAIPMQKSFLGQQLNGTSSVRSASRSPFWTQGPLTFEQKLARKQDQPDDIVLFPDRLSPELAHTKALDTVVL